MAAIKSPTSKEGTSPVARKWSRDWYFLAIAATAALLSYITSELWGIGFFIVAFIARIVSDQSDEMFVRLKEQDQEFDTSIDDQIERAAESTYERLNDLEREKKALPQIDFAAVDGIPKWSEYLTREADKLRPLIYDYGVLVFEGEELTTRVPPMNHEWAHALAELAHGQVDLKIKNAEWLIAKAKALGESKRKYLSKEAVSAERYMREIDVEVQELRSKIVAYRKAANEAGSRAERDFRDELRAQGRIK